MRVSKVAKELNISIRQVLDYINQLDADTNMGPLSNISDELYVEICKVFNNKKPFVKTIEESKKYDTINDFVLPDGSIYNGECINRSGFIEICGQGEVIYKNGDKYKGVFKLGRPLGWGKYTFSNGHTHSGFFDNLPKGLGYLNEDYNMCLGFFYNGKLDGWGICYRQHIFRFGFWKNGKLVLDETKNTYWIRREITKSFYGGNYIQIDNEHEYIRFGIPEKFLMERVPGIPESIIPKSPAIGFEFFNNGSVIVGFVNNHNTGDYIHYYNDMTIESGRWNNGVRTHEITISDFQNPNQRYEEDGWTVYELFS